MDVVEVQFLVGAEVDDVAGDDQPHDGLEGVGGAGDLMAQGRQQLQRKMGGFILDLAIGIGNSGQFADVCMQFPRHRRRGNVEVDLRRPRQRPLDNLPLQRGVVRHHPANVDRMLEIARNAVEGGAHGRSGMVEGGWEMGDGR